jgi:hypothetical protein
VAGGARRGAATRRERGPRRGWPTEAGSLPTSPPPGAPRPLGSEPARYGRRRTVRADSLRPMRRMAKATKAAKPHAATAAAVPSTRARSQPPPPPPNSAGGRATSATPALDTASPAAPAAPSGSPSSGHAASATATGLRRLSDAASPSGSSVADTYDVATAHVPAAPRSAR